MHALIKTDAARELAAGLFHDAPQKLEIRAYGANIAIGATSIRAVERLQKVYRYFLADAGALASTPQAYLMLAETDHSIHTKLSPRLRPLDPIGVTTGHLLIASWLDFALSVTDLDLLHYYASKLVRLYLVACHNDELMTVHAASLNSGAGEGLLMVGEAATGKTTLSLRLIEHGLQFCSDDTSCIRRDDGICMPFPLAFVLRGIPGATPPLAPGINGRAPDLAILDEPRWFHECPAAIGGSFRPRLIVLLHDRSDREPGAFRSVAPATAALELLRNVVVPLGVGQLDDRTTARNFDLVCDLVNEAECLEVNSTNLDRTFAALLSTIKSRFG